MRIALLVLGALLWLAGACVTVLECLLTDASYLDSLSLVLGLGLVVSGALLSLPALGPKAVGAVLLVTGAALAAKPFAVPFVSTSPEAASHPLSLGAEANLYFFGGAAPFVALGIVLLLRRGRPAEPSSRG